MKKKHLALSIIVACILGFIVAQGMKSNYRIFQKRIFLEAEFKHEFYAEAGINYIVSIWGSSENRVLKEWATLEMRYQLLNASGTMIADTTITAIGGKVSEGNMMARNGKDIHFKTEESGTIVLKCWLVEGDYIDVEIYKALPENIYFLPPLFIFGFVFGLFWYMKVRNLS